MKVSPRAAAARAVAAVLAGASLDDALATEDQHLTGPDRGLLRALAYGVLREHALLASLAGSMIAKPLGVPDVQALVEVGLFQLRTMRVSPHAAVSETVDACDVLEKPKHRGFVNAILRRYQREREALEAQLPTDDATRLSYPQWMVDAVRRDWGDRATLVLEAGNEPGPMTLRVNRRRTSVTDYAATLRQAGIESRPVEGAVDALVVDRSVGVDRLPAFEQGAASVQDASAQLAADVLDVKPGMRVLDACAAPGGKAAHVLEREDVELVALDRDAQRLERVTQTLVRLGLPPAQTLALDAALFAQRWDGAPFDRILLDAPCSGTGVIRRHPDIKWLRRQTDIAAMAAEQLWLLQGLWNLLAPGGVMVYATCSVLAAEGEDVIKQFLLRRADARHEPIEASWGEARRFGRRMAPGGYFDGFYYAKLRRP